MAVSFAIQLFNLIPTNGTSAISLRAQSETLNGQRFFRTLLCVAIALFAI